MTRLRQQILDMVDDPTVFDPPTRERACRVNVADAVGIMAVLIVVFIFAFGIGRHLHG